MAELWLSLILDWLFLSVFTSSNFTLFLSDGKNQLVIKRYPHCSKPLSAFWSKHWGLEKDTSVLPSINGGFFCLQRRTSQSPQIPWPKHGALPLSYTTQAFQHSNDGTRTRDIRGCCSIQLNYPPIGGEGIEPSTTADDRKTSSKKQHILTYRQILQCYTETPVWSFLLSFSSGNSRIRTYWVIDTWFTVKHVSPYYVVFPYWSPNGSSFYHHDPPMTIRFHIQSFYKHHAVKQNHAWGLQPLSRFTGKRLFYPSLSIAADTGIEPVTSEPNSDILPLDQSAINKKPRPE